MVMNLKIMQVTTNKLLMMKIWITSKRSDQPVMNEKSF